MQHQRSGIPSHLLGYRFQAARRQSPHMKRGAQLGAARLTDSEIGHQGPAKRGAFHFYICR